MQRKITNIADLTDNDMLSMLEKFPSREKIASVSDLTDDELNAMQKDLPNKLAAELFRDSKSFQDFVNDQENWKKLIIKDGMTVPTAEDLAKSETKTHREYYVKRSRSSMGFFEKAARGSEDPGMVLGNTLAGMFAGMGEMVKGIEQGATSSTSDPFQPLNEAAQAQKDGQKKEVNPFELVGRIFGSLAQASARAEQAANNNGAANADNSAANQNEANNSENAGEPIRIQCAQQ